MSLAALTSLGALLVLWTSYAMCLLVVIDTCVFGRAPGSLGALIVLWASHVVCLLVVTDACVFGGVPRERRCARLARRPACVVDFICYESFCGC